MSNQIIGGRYRLSSRLGEGAMAEVHFGLDLELRRPVAVKRLRPELAADPVARAAFEREVRIGRELSHPNIVCVLDAGTSDDPDTGVPVPYIVLEFVPGMTLQQHLDLRDGHPMPPGQAVGVVGALLSALASSHATGVIHQAVEPGNVMVTPDGRVKLMGFGIARSLDEDAPAPTSICQTRGSVGYVAPERLRGGISDARTDLYSVGWLLYRLLVGSAPFQGHSTADMLTRQLSDAPSRPSQARPDLGTRFDTVVLRALAKDPEDRYPSAAAMAAALADQSGVRAGAGPRALAAAGPVRSARRQRLVAAGVAAALLPLAGLAVQSLDRGENHAGDLSTAAALGRPTAPPAGALPKPSVADEVARERGSSQPRLAASPPSLGAARVPSASPSGLAPPTDGNQVPGLRRSSGRSSTSANASLGTRPTTAAQADGAKSQPVRQLPPRNQEAEPVRPRPPKQAVRPPDAPAPAGPPPVAPSPPAVKPPTPDKPQQPPQPPPVEAVPKPAKPDKPPKPPKAEKPSKPPKPPKPDEVEVEVEVEVEIEAATEALSAGEAGLG